MLEVELDHDVLLNNFFGDQRVDRSTFTYDASVSDGGFPFDKEDKTLKQMFVLEVPTKRKPGRSGENNKKEANVAKRKTGGVRKPKESLKKVEKPMFEDLKLEPLTFTERDASSYAESFEEDLTELVKIVLDDKEQASIKTSNRKKLATPSHIPRKLTPVKLAVPKKLPLPKIKVVQKHKAVKKTLVTAATTKKKRKHGSLESPTSIATNFDYDSSTSKSDVSESADSGEKRRRTKWLPEDTRTLWHGILKYGNNWSEIKCMLPGRTYYQVKDKGRRLLHRKGWKTGRSKNDACGAGECAKGIAKSMLSESGPRNVPIRLPVPKSKLPRVSASTPLSTKGASAM